MYDQGHFCLLVFAQGTWKPHYKEKLIKKIADNFFSLIEPRSEEEARIVGWNEAEKSPLQDPKKLDYCKVCNRLAPLFKENLRDNEGFILFSHSIPDLGAFLPFFSNLFRETGIKKAFYLEADIFSENKIIRKRDIPTKQVKVAEFFELIKKEQFEQATKYEILKY